MSRERLTERAIDWQLPAAHIDRESLIVTDVALAGRNSRNGYIYSETALADAVPLYEGRPVFLDHAPNAARPHERSTRDLVGSIRNVHFKDGRVRGDIHVLNTESGRTFLTLAESATTSVGMSHVVLAFRSPDKKQVERIDEVISVDAVVFPATTSTFQEQQTEDTIMPLFPDSFEEALDAIDSTLAQQDESLQRIATFDNHLATNSPAEPDTYHIHEWYWTEHDELEISDPLTTVTLDDLTSGEWQDLLPTGFTPVDNEDDWESESIHMQRLQRKYDRLLRKHTTLLSEKQNTRSVIQLLKNSRLPAAAITSEFRTLLKQTKDPAFQQQLISEREKLCQQWQQTTPTSHPRQPQQPNTLKQSFLKALKR